MTLHYLSFYIKRSNKSLDKIEFSLLKLKARRIWAKKIRIVQTLSS